MTTTPGELGLLCMAGTGGKPEQRCINPLAINKAGEIDWSLYNDRTRAKAKAFGVTKRFVWCAGGTKKGTDLALDQWRLLYPNVFDRAKATQQFASCFGKGDVAYVGGCFSEPFAWNGYTGVVERSLLPFLGCDAIGLDATSGYKEGHVIFELARFLSAGGIRPLTESLIHRDTAWNSPEFGCVITAEQWLKYRGPADKWTSKEDQRLLLPLDEYQCQLHILCVGPEDSAGKSPTLAEVVQMLAAGHSVWVNPTAGKYRGQTAAGIMAMVRKVVKA